MTELNEPFGGVDGAFKFFVYKFIPICNLLPSKKLNLWYVLLYGHKNNYFHQKQHLGLHEKMLIN